MKQVANSPHYKQRGNWAQLIFAKTSGTVSRDTGKKWAIADQRALSNSPTNNCGRLSAPAPFSFLSGECSPAADL